MKILLDENISSDLPLLEKLLREVGYDLVSMSDIAPRTLDPDVLKIAAQEGRTIITQDGDFSAHRFHDNLSIPYGVIFIDIGKYAKYKADRQNPQLIRRLGIVIDSIAREPDLRETVMKITMSPNGAMKLRPKRDKNRKETSTGFVYIEESIGLAISETIVVTTTTQTE